MRKVLIQVEIDALFIAVQLGQRPGATVRKKHLEECDHTP